MSARRLVRAQLPWALGAGLGAVACAAAADAPPLPPDVGASHPPGETVEPPPVPPPDAGPAETAAPDAGPGDAAPPSAAEAGGPAPLVEIGDVKFENGEVPTLETALQKLLPQVARCVAERGGLSAATGRLRVQMLVRARERAEGVEVSEPKGITADAATCIRLALKDKWVGAPSAEFVEARLVLSFKPGKEAR